MSQPRWPNGARATISFTMDNLGEAQDVNRGVWTAPIGTHPAVTNQLPRMLDLLSRYSLKATYFVEAWSLSVYPSVIKDLISRGHEVAWHGYQHEPWMSLSSSAEVTNFERSFSAAREQGVRYSGFRPPGGSTTKYPEHNTPSSTAQSFALLRRHGIRYVSPLETETVKLGIHLQSGSKQPGGDEGIVVLPFEWRAVDAFYYMDKFSSIRKDHGEQEGVLSPDDFRTFLLKQIEQTKENNGYMSILFHPFLQTSEDKFAVLGEVLQRLSADEDIWCAPCNEVAEWVAEHSDLFEKSRIG
ncbi:hypothetical protein QBC46DRAFT_297107 [Diplogelasinospora grovesii]|uniref:NodB homology domain-containing protein n=1 Tax=Diplogelasinospora grovesii TaxID=303347 RepID=A0AAN6S0H9_9PEZI|nr:hypothetical protein QBC46DRAFT_297107 [Diplogelasinospora grovesii]